ncbi:MAG: hypothetical protein ACP5VP_02825 [Candidatus Limnocylindrales bacterium]
MADPDTGGTSTGILDALLGRLEAGGVRTPADLARELGISPALVDAMILDLERRGYLRPVTAACDAACAGCPLAGTCSLAGQGRGWTLDRPSLRGRPRSPERHP